MNKPENLINQRRKYVREEVSRAQKHGIKTSYAVRTLSERLFLSERAIYKDLSA